MSYLFLICFAIFRVLGVSQYFLIFSVLVVHLEKHKDLTPNIFVAYFRTDRWSVQSLIDRHSPVAKDCIWMAKN